VSSLIKPLSEPLLVGALIDPLVGEPRASPPLKPIKTLLLRTRVSDLAGLLAPIQVAGAVLDRIIGSSAVPMTGLVF
jgi:hypothetical protein